MRLRTSSIKKWRGKIYLDHSATTPVAREVFEAMKPYFSKKFGNASTLYSMGTEAKKAMENAREQVARVIKAEPSEIYFTSGGTESDNLALRNFDNILTSKIEHPAVLNTCKLIKNVYYASVTNEGYVKINEIEGIISKNKIAFVSIMQVNNEIGTIQPISKIHHICKKNNIPFHTDAVQGFGKIETNSNDFEMLSLSAHKIYGPKGIGAFYLEQGLRLKPIITGGGHENNLRAGTENIAGIVGLGAAAEIAQKSMINENKRLAELRDRLKKGIFEQVDHIWMNGGPNRLSGNLHLGVAGIEGEALILMLDEYNICASTGSACSSKSLKPSHVLSAIGLKPQESHGSLRLTLGRGNTKEEIDYAIEVIPEIIKRLREISPLYKKS